MLMDIFFISHSNWATIVSSTVKEQCRKDHLQRLPDPIKKLKVQLLPEDNSVNEILPK